ncbi:MAG: DUF4367 domain-containing protein [Clostridiales bacterium]|jgi:hypothetical protein|nr:DUF4367 domain-containing protein [Clostridiales bacterium]
MNNKDYDLDAMLSQALESTEKPAPALLSKIKDGESGASIRSTRFRKPSLAFAVTLAVVLTLSAATFAAAPAIIRYFDARIISGQEFVNDFRPIESEDGINRFFIVELNEEAIDYAGSGTITAYMEGWGEIVLFDVLRLFDLDEALSLLDVENPLIPSYLPEGFAFRHATFFRNPITNPGHPVAARNLLITFSNEDEHIYFRIRRWTSGVIEPGTADPHRSDPHRTEITINGHAGGVFGGRLSLEVDDVIYDIVGPLSKDQLIKMAESMQ